MANGQRGLDAGGRWRPEANPRQARGRLRLLECLLRSGRLVLPCRKQIGWHQEACVFPSDGSWSPHEGYDVGGRLAESCMDGCYDSDGALGAQQVGKASAHLLSRHFASCPDGIGCSWHVAFTAWQPKAMYHM